FGERFPGIIERIDTSLPLWWLVLAAPGMVAVGAARKRRAMARLGAAGCALGAALFADVARSPVTPGAHDNLSAVAVLVALVERAADEAGAPLRRWMRSRASTDAVIPSRAGYPTVTIASTDRYKALANYHKMTDTPENVSYRTVFQALTVTEAVAEQLGVAQ